MLRKLIRYSLFVIAFLALGFIGCNQSGSGKDDLELQAFVEKMASTQEFVIVDVRTPDEFERGHIESAQNINAESDNFEAEFSKLDKDVPVFMYCYTDARSGNAASRMRKEGYTVYLLKGGMLAWRSENLPEVKGAATFSVGMSMEDFESMITSDKLVLVDFYADWCGPCKKMEPFLHELETEMESSLKLVRIDTDKNPLLAQQMGIQALPFLQAYRSKKKVWENLGFINKEGLTEQIQKHL